MGMISKASVQTWHSVSFISTCAGRFAACGAGQAAASCLLRGARVLIPAEAVLCQISGCCRTHMDAQRVQEQWCTMQEGSRAMGKAPRLKGAEMAEALDADSMVSAEGLLVL